MFADIITEHLTVADGSTAGLHLPSKLVKKVNKEDFFF